MKALGTGHSRGVIWRDVEVVRLGGPRNCGSTAPPRSVTDPLKPMETTLDTRWNASGSCASPACLGPLSAGRGSALFADPGFGPV
jgi:hypothetical protein